MAILWRTIARHGMAAGGLAATILAAATAQAQSTWDGGGANNNLSTAGNWVGDAAPVYPTSLVFGGLTRLTPTNDNPAGTVVNGLTFDATAGSFNLSGNSITLGAAFLNPGIAVDNSLGANNGGIRLSSLAASTVAAPLVQAAGRHVFTTDVTAGTLTLSGAVTRQTGSNANFIVNGGNINTTAGSGLVNDATGILGGWAVTGTDPSLSSWASRDGSGNIVPYTAFSSTFSSADPFPATTASSNIKFTGGGDITVPSATAVNTILYSEQSNLATAINLTDTLTFSNGGGIFRSGDVASQTGATTAQRITGGSMTAGTAGPATLHIRTRTSAAPNPGIGPPEGLFVLTPITDNAGSGAVSVVKSGFGVLRLSPPTPSTFTGGLYVNEGQLRPTTVDAMGAATSPIYVAADAQVLVNTNTEIKNPWFIKGIGPQEQGGALGEFRGGAIRVNNTGSTYSGTITLQGDAGIGGRGGQVAGATAGSLFTGKITGPYNLRLNRQTNQGAAGLEASMPTFTLSNSTNDWSGGTSIGNGRIRIGANEVIPDGPGMGNVEMVGELTTNGTTPGSTLINLSGNTETVNGLTATGLVTSAAITNNTPATVGTIRIGNNNATSTFSGSIQDSTGSINVVKLGSGTLTLDSATNTWAGDTKVFGGTLSLTAVPTWNAAGTASVQITGSSILNLNFAGDVFVNAFYINGVARPAGDYTSANSSGRITGTGVLHVAAAGAALIPGDFDGNGLVNALDLAQWRHDYGVNGGSDADFDGDTDGIDFAIWQRNAVSGPAVPASGAVPEPGSLALLGVAALGLVAANRKRG